MIINKIPLIRNSTMLGIQPVVENNMWEDEKFLQRTANQNFFDYPRVRIGQAGTVVLAMVMPHSFGFALDCLKQGNLTSALVGYGITIGTVLGIVGCAHLMIDSHDWDNYIYKIEAKDCLRKLNRKKKLAMKKNKEAMLETEK